MFSWLSYQYNLLLLALSFFTRLPLPQNIAYSPKKMHQGGQHIAVVGGLLALLLSGFYLLLSPHIGSAPSLCLVLILSLLLTGALHEDGLADTCDGFWGAADCARKLNIMKDSQLGTYGTCALLMILLSKFILLAALARQNQLVLSLCIAYPLSRGLAISHVQHLVYARIDSPPGEQGKGKSHALAQPFSNKSLLWLFLSSAFTLVFIPFTTALLLLLACAILRLALKYWFKQHIGGYTGDCLGFAQQCQELLIYLLLLAMLAPTASSATTPHIPL